MINGDGHNDNDDNGDNDYFFVKPINAFIFDTLSLLYGHNSLLALERDECVFQRSTSKVAFLPVFDAVRAIAAL